MERESVYIETSVISYLCSRPSRDLIIAANQELVHEWWEGRRHEFALFVSEIVLAEIAGGDPVVARKRLNLVSSLPTLDANTDAEQLEYAIASTLRLPDKLTADAAHIAIAAVHGANYLLTLNCKHIANPYWMPTLKKVIEAEGFNMPVICTPQELLEGERT
jgi:predicted nucleic acid-binding protein